MHDTPLKYQHVVSSRENQQLLLHPDGKDGPNTNVKPKLTIGQPIGSGSYGEVHDVKSHDLDHSGNLVMKKFTPNPQEPDAAQHELENLRTVDKIRASGQDEDGYTWAAIDKSDGYHFMETNAYKEARKQDKHAGDGYEARDAVLNRAKILRGQAQVDLVAKYGVFHSDPDWRNFKVNHEVTKGEFVDFGRLAEAGDKPSLGRWSDEEMSHLREGWPGRPGSLTSMEHDYQSAGGDFSVAAA